MFRCLKEAVVWSSLVFLISLSLTALPPENSQGLAATAGMVTLEKKKS